MRAGNQASLQRDSNQLFAPLSIDITLRAGLPKTRTLGGTSAVTTAIEAITLLFPIVTPGNTVALAPIQTLSPIVTGRTSRSNAGLPAFRASGSSGWPGESNMCTPPAIR